MERCNQKVDSLAASSAFATCSPNGADDDRLLAILVKVGSNFRSLGLAGAPIDFVQTRKQPLRVGDLNSQAGPGVSFQKHRAFVGINDNVHADIAQANLPGN